MTDYACIYATGTLIRDLSKTLMESGVAVRADLLETFPMYFKNDKVKTGSNADAVIILVERDKLDEAMRAIQSQNQQNGPGLFYQPILAYALSVLAITGI